MVGRKTVSQAYGKIKRLSVVHLFECSCDAQKYTITDGEGVLLSDKLLARRHTESVQEPFSSQKNEKLWYKRHTLLLFQTFLCYTSLTILQLRENCNRYATTTTITTAVLLAPVSTTTTTEAERGHAMD